MAILEPGDPDPEGPYRDVVCCDVPLRVFTGQQRVELDTSDEAEWCLDPAPALRAWHSVVPAATLAVVAKAFDDGVYAAVEVWQQRNGKRDVIEALRDHHPLLAAAAALGGGSAISPHDGEAALLRDAFLADELRSTPMGYYTWSRDLQNVFSQDRLLQSPLFPGADPRLGGLVRALHADTRRRHLYERSVRIAERLTNPLVLADLRPWLRSVDAASVYEPPPMLAWLPASTSHEERLARALLGTDPVPAGFDLMAELVQRVRSGEVSLEPGPASGWYDHQTWAHAALLTADRNEEATHLAVSEEFHKHLEAAFKAAATLTRETHIKQAAPPFVGAALGDRSAPRRVKVFVDPGVTVEPLVTHYERRAAAYRFVHRLLEDELGSQVLAGLRRETPEGPAEQPLGDELVGMIELFSCAASRARSELGMTTAADDGRFDALISGLRTHPDVVRDTRAMVPVFHDLERRQTKVWCMLGWASYRGAARFRTPPPVRVLSDAAVDLVYTTQRFWLPVPVMREVYTRRLLNRDEFRHLCDRERTAEKIVAAIEVL